MVIQSHMRDVVDISRLRKEGYFLENPLSTLEEEQIDAIREKTKIAKVVDHVRKPEFSQEQIKRCYEILLLHETNLKDPKDYKEYRLLIKRRLFKKFQDVLSEIPTQEKRKEELNERYKEVEAEYKRVLQKIFPASE